VKSNPVRIHSAIIEGTDPAHKLWYLMRSANASGNGRCFLPVQYILDTLKISKSTFRRYYSNPDFFCQDAQRKPNLTDWKDYLVVYPVGVAKVCLVNNIRTLGVVSEINQEDLVSAKKFSALSQILDLQNRSRHIANQTFRKAALDLLGKKRLPKGYHVEKALTDNQIYSLFNNSTGEIPSEFKAGIVKLEKKRILVNDSWVVFGGSQNTVALKSNKTIRTINNRLKGFNKLSIAQASSDNFSIYEELKFSDSEHWSVESRKYFKKDGYCFERLCSIYQPILHLFNCRYLRKKLNKLWAKVGQSLEPSAYSEALG